MHPTRVLQIQPTRLLLRPVPKEEHSGMNCFINPRAKDYRRIMKLTPHLESTYYITAFTSAEENPPRVDSAGCRTRVGVPPGSFKQSEPGLIISITNESVAIGAAIYSLGNKLVTDKTLRLTRSNPRDK